MVKVPPWQCPSSAPAPPRGAPGGSGQRGTPRVRPRHWAPSHCLGCSSDPPPKSPISPPLTMQEEALRRVAHGLVTHEARIEDGDWKGISVRRPRRPRRPLPPSPPPAALAAPCRLRRSLPPSPPSPPSLPSSSPSRLLPPAAAPAARHLSCYPRHLGPASPRLAVASGRGRAPRRVRTVRAQQAGGCSFVACSLTVSLPCPHRPAITSWPTPRRAR